MITPDPFDHFSPGNGTSSVRNEVLTVSSNPVSVEQRVQEFINKIQDVSALSFSNSSVVARLFYMLLDSLPFFHSHHLHDYDEQKAQELKELKNSIYYFTDTAAELISSITDETELDQGVLRDRLHQELLLFYRKTLSRFNQSPFSEEKKMAVDVQHFLCPQLAQYRLDKVNKPELVRDADHKLLRKIAKAQLAVMLGHGSTPNVGAQGTLIVTDINNKRIGIHKVSRDDVPCTTRIKNFFNSFFGQLSLLSRKSMSLLQSEKAAYLMSREFHFDMAPPSADAALKTKGVMQLFVSREKEAAMLQVREAVDGLADKQADQEERRLVKAKQGLSYALAAKEMEELQKDTNQFSEAEISLFQKFAIFDYLIGNLDRHEENWFVIFAPAPNEPGKRVLTHIKAIDNANAFPKTYRKPFEDPNPSILDVAFFPHRNQYKWKHLPIAKAPLTQQTKEFITKNLSPRSVAEVLNKVTAEIPDFFDEEMLALFHVRASHIQAMVELPYTTPHDLANSSLA